MCTVCTVEWLLQATVLCISVKREREIQVGAAANNSSQLEVDNGKHMAAKNIARAISISDFSRNVPT